jgi:hypothetical protein
MQDNNNKILSALDTVITKEQQFLLLRHKLQIFAFWAVILMAIGAFCGLQYSSRENKKFFKVATVSGSFYYVDEKGKERVYDITERIISAPAAQSTTPIK